MALLLYNSYVCIDVFPLLICILLHIDYVIRCIDVTLIIRYILWDVYHKLAERQIVVLL
jgi:hypothetical protein